MQNAFLARDVPGLEANVRTAVDELLDPLGRVGRMDLVADFAHPLPAIVIAELFGMPRGERERLEGWSDRLGRFVLGNVENTAHDAKYGGAARAARGHGGALPRPGGGAPPVSPGRLHPAPAARRSAPERRRDRPHPDVRPLRRARDDCQPHRERRAVARPQSRPDGAPAGGARTGRGCGGGAAADGGAGADGLPAGPRGRRVRRNDDPGGGARPPGAERGQPGPGRIRAAGRSRHRPGPGPARQLRARRPLLPRRAARAARGSGRPSGPARTLRAPGDRIRAALLAAGAGDPRPAGAPASLRAVRRTTGRPTVGPVRGGPAPVLPAPDARPERRPARQAGRPGRGRRDGGGGDVAFRTGGGAGPPGVGAPHRPAPRKDPDRRRRLPVAERGHPRRVQRGGRRPVRQRPGLRDDPRRLRDRHPHRRLYLARPSLRGARRRDRRELHDRDPGGGDGRVRDWGQLHRRGGGAADRRRRRSARFGRDRVPGQDSQEMQFVRREPAERDAVPPQRARLRGGPPSRVARPGARGVGRGGAGAESNASSPAGTRPARRVERRRGDGSGRSPTGARPTAGRERGGLGRLRSAPPGPLPRGGASGAAVLRSAMRSGSFSRSCSWRS